ncbi:MAG: GNAT family N-acetyltransferase [Pseudomonadota bacterium]
MLEARAARPEDRATLEALNVGPEQRRFVSSNQKTFLQWPNEAGAEVFVLWDGHVAVGLMACIDLRLATELSAEDDPNTAFLWRLMIADRYQGKGYGRAALGLFESWASNRGLRRLETSVVPDNQSARRLYTAFGFEPTSRVLEGEDVLVRSASYMGL